MFSRKSYSSALLLALVLMVASAASAEINVENGANPQDIEISLTIQPFTNVWWAPADQGYSQDGNDQTILFNDIVQDGNTEGDWHSDVLVGAYGPTDKASTDAFAEGYFESYDAALFWLESNVNTTMTLQSQGNMSNGSAELPTWYTIAFTNNVDPLNPGFINAGQHDPNAQPIPGDGDGSYGDDADGDGTMSISGGSHYPNQYAFPMVDGSGNTTDYQADFEGFAQGTILFHGRALRSGITDPNGAYTTTLTVSFQ